MTKVKICGITNLEDALVSAKFGADALGFNFYEKSPRYITPERAREIIEQLPPEILKVGVFVNESLEKIAEIAQTAKLDALQLHGEETPEFARELKAKTNLEVIKAFRVSPEFKPEDVLLYETDAILLDAYNPKEQGGTGETFDWEIAKKVQAIFPKMYLAGGLSEKNLMKLLRQFEPYAVDACSLLEKRKGKKDESKLRNFLWVAEKSPQEIHKIKFKVEKPKNIYEVLNPIKLRPGMYFGRKTIWGLQNYLFGFEDALKFSKADFDTRFFFSEFESWALKKLIGKSESPYRLVGVLLQKSGNDEEKAFDQYFELLEEFKLEKEDLSNE
jgi:phosphoribosylanthranilate isomerase